MPAVDHAIILQNPWLVAAIALTGGGLAGGVAGFVHNDLGLGPRLVIVAGIALIIFGAIWFLAPAQGG